MRAFVAVFASISFALLGACANSISDTNYAREGIGVELSRSMLPEQTVLQNQYLAALCQQTSPSLVGTDCTEIPPGLWPLIVQAGMNDIDLRCDAYLTWLDSLRRSSGPILQEITDLSVATGTIMAVTGASPKSLAIVGAAFGLAYSTFTNINHRLLVEIDKSTVQALVLHRRTDYRLGLNGVIIDSRPKAIYILRSYLNLCLPFTIETDINTTVIGMQQAGPLANLNPLITPPVPMRAPPLTAGNVIGAPIRTPPLPPEPFAKFFDEKNLSARDVDRVRSALCAPENEGGGLDQETLMQSVVAIYEDTNRAEITNKLTKTERQNLVRDASAQARLAGQGKACGNTKTLNYFEWRTYANAAKDAKANAAAVEGLIRLLNVSVPGGQLNPKTTTLDAARSKIFAVRADPALANDLKFTKSLPAQFQNQMTRELFAALFKLRATQKPTEPPSDQPAPPAPPANQGNKP